MGLEPWCHAELSSRLWVLNGSETLKELIPGLTNDNLVEALDQLSAARVRLQTMDRITLFNRNFLGSVHGVVFMAPNRRILDVNRAFLDMQGLALRDVVDKTPDDFRVWEGSLDPSPARAPGDSWST